MKSAGRGVQAADGGKTGGWHHELGLGVAEVEEDAGVPFPHRAGLDRGRGEENGVEPDGGAAGGDSRRTAEEAEARGAPSAPPAPKIDEEGSGTI